MRPGGAGTVGNLVIDGDYTQAGGLLEIDIDSAVSFDVLEILIAGDLTGGIVDTNFINVPAVGDSYQVTICAPCTGNFATINSPPGIGLTELAPGLLEVSSLSFFWDGGAGTSAWEDALNWSLDIVPDAGTDVNIIDAVIDVNAPTTINSLTILGNTSLDIDGAALTLATGSLDTNAGSALDLIGAGTLDVTGDVNADGDLQLSSGVLAVAGNATFNGGFGLSGTAIARFEGSALLNGVNNTWAGGAIESSSGAGVVTLGVGRSITLSGGNAFKLENILFDMNGQTMTLSNNGDLDIVNGATLQTGIAGQMVSTANGDITNSQGVGTLDIISGSCPRF